MREEVKRIIKLVQEGKLSADDAAELIDAFNQGEVETIADESHEGSTPPPPPPGSDANKDPFKSFVEAIEKIGKEASESVNWQEVAKQVREGASKGVDALKSGLEQVSKGKFTINIGGMHETREVTLPISVPEGKTLRIDNACGDVKVVGGFDVGSATARARFRGATKEEAKEKADAYSLIIEESDHMVLIKQPDVSGLSVDVEIQLPGTAPVEVRCTSGDVSLVDTGAGARIDGTSGDVKLRGLNGPVETSLTSGDISIEDTNSALIAIENKSGDISLKRVTANINARTASGDIELDTCGGRTISVESVSGDVEIELVQPVVGTLNVRTVNGDTHISLIDGNDCRVSLSTLRGDVSCELPLSDEAKTGQHITGRLGDGAGALDVSAVTGDICVRLKDFSPKEDEGEDEEHD